MWYRVEVARDGTIVGTPTLVENRGTDRGQVVYVDVPGSGDETRDKTEACRLAKEVAKQWLLKKNAQSLAAKKKRLAKGECRSCREPLFSAQYCEYHTKKHNASAAQRYRDRRDGITKKPRKYATPLESFQAEKKTRKLIHRTSGSKDGRYLAWFKHELSHAQQAVSLDAHIRWLKYQITCLELKIQERKNLLTAQAAE